MIANQFKYQSGATLFVALVFLLIMTLFAVSSINLSTINLKIVGNMQAIKQMEAAALDSQEQVLSNSNFFTSPADFTQTVTIANTDFNVTVEAADCINSQTAAGYSAVVENIIPQDNTFVLRTKVDDPDIDGAENLVTVQGVGLRMLAGNCK